MRTNVLAYSNALLPWNIPIARKNPSKQSLTLDLTRLNVKLHISGNISLLAYWQSYESKLRSTLEEVERLQGC